MSANFGNNFLANSHYYLMLNEINCNSKKRRIPKKKPKSLNFLITKKINKTNINVGDRTKLE